MSLLAHGRSAYARRISHDAALARYLGARVEERPEFELATPGRALDLLLPLRARRICPAATDRDEYLDRLNERLMTEIQLDGRVFFSNAVLGGRFVLRACIVNFRTEADDIDAVLDVAAELGAALDAELRPARARGRGVSTCRAARAPASSSPGRPRWTGRLLERANARRPRR